MITIFTTLKPPIKFDLFKESQKRAKEEWKRAITYEQHQKDVHIIEENALQSWIRLGVEVILFGDEAHEPGSGALAERLGCRYLPVQRNKWGTPLVGSLLSEARSHARYDLLCLCNADIVLMDDFKGAVLRTARIRKGKPFVLIGSGYNLDNPPPLEFGEGWQGRLTEYVKTHCGLQSRTGMDFWAHTRQTYKGCDFGPMAIGRYKWDNCMVALPRNRGVPIVDVTASVVSIRQRDNIKFPRSNAEAQHNMAWGKARCAGGHLTNAEWVLTKKGLVKKK